MKIMVFIEYKIRFFKIILKNIKVFKYLVIIKYLKVFNILMILFRYKNI